MELSNEMNATWRDIQGYEDVYQISDRGVVRSLVLGRELKATPDSRGLCRVSLRWSGKIDRPYVHQLVMQAFGESANGRKAIAHIDGNAANNSIDNLCWVERTWDKKEAINRGESGASIARRYNISTTNVSSIKNNKIWKAIV